MMKELELLLNRRWILKSEDKELYYKIRDSIGEIRQYVTEKLGCQIIENSLLIKLEKIPAIPESYMGIEELLSKEEYAILCILLMFLEDKDAGDQFLLSQLTEFIEGQMPKGSIDWTIYSHRRRLVRVLRYAVDELILKVTDGSDEGFVDQEIGEVLYENTGASRYFVKNFSRDIMGYTKPEDFRESDWFDINEDRGIARRHRVYKSLLFSVGMYRGVHSDEDFDYLKRYGYRLNEEFEQNFDCDLHIHKGSAFLIMGENSKIGTSFPGRNAISDILLLCFSKIRQRIEDKEWNLQKNERVIVSQVEFEKLLCEVKNESSSGFTKSYREMTQGEFILAVTKEMMQWKFIEVNKEEHFVEIYPAVGKLGGYYPKDFKGDANE
ncbi:hypothetical protein P261_00936 [Lachnospiraceae bacterium TWA4]|nr:hypothetical protein P261_00936 [Lachnospiraceae bacterium TWA4]